MPWTCLTRFSLLAATCLAVSPGTVCTRLSDFLSASLMRLSIWPCVLACSTCCAVRPSMLRLTVSRDSSPALRSTTRLPTASIMVSSWLMRLFHAHAHDQKEDQADEQHSACGTQQNDGFLVPGFGQGFEFAWWLCSSRGWRLQRLRSICWRCLPSRARLAPVIGIVGKRVRPHWCRCAGLVPQF